LHLPGPPITSKIVELGVSRSSIACARKRIAYFKEAGRAADREQTSWNSSTVMSLPAFALDALKLLDARRDQVALALAEMPPLAVERARMSNIEVAIFIVEVVVAVALLLAKRWQARTLRAGKTSRSNDAVARLD
jgi:hypothetical protein